MEIDLKSFKVFEMAYTWEKVPKSNICPVPLSEQFYDEYTRIYNECFYDMRMALDIEPYNYYSSFQQLNEKRENIFLLVENEVLIGSVACFGTEIDDLIVNRDYQGRGYGRSLLLWAIAHIRTYTSEPITLHVAEWNQRAVKLYLQNGFEITATKVIERDK